MERERPEETSAPLPRPLGAYVLLKSLGRGGMGSVFLALQRLEIFERLCVIKVIRQRLVNHERHRLRFLDEARTTLSLTHRNVSRVLDVGVEDGTIYLAMEYVAGRDLRSVIKRCAERGERVPAAIAVFILAELLEALEAAHTHVDAVTGKPAPIVHRDVSPHNVIIGFDGGVKLIDFGVASSAVATAHTDPGLVLGKTAYMSPEQAEGKPVDGRTDVFAAAILGVELLGGARFYGDMSVDAIGAALETATHRPTCFKDIPAGVREILDSALALDPASRPSAGAFAAKLRAWAHTFRQSADAASTRSFLSARFPHEEEQERALHQELLRMARGDGAGTHAPHDAPVSVHSRATEIAPGPADAPTESGANDTPTSLERRRKGDSGSPVRRRDATVITHSGARRARLVPAVAIALLASAVALVLLMIARVERAPRDAPTSVAAALAYDAGIAHRRALELRAARERFEEAARLEPGHALTHARLAQTMFLSSQVVDARVAAGRAVDLAGSLPEHARDLVTAVEAEAARDYDRAIAALARRAQGPDGELEDWLELARVQIAGGQPAQALESLARTRQRPDAPSVLALLLILESRAASALGDADRSLLAARAARAEAKGADALTAYARLSEGTAMVGFAGGSETYAVLAEALELFTKLGDDGGRAAALLAQSAIEDDGRTLEARVASIEEALTLFRAVRDREGEALTLNNLAALTEMHRPIEEHLQLLKQALLIHREIKDDRGVATAGGNLAQALAFEGELESAHVYAREAAAAARACPHAVDRVEALTTLAEIELMRGNARAARAIVDEVLALISDAVMKNSRAYAMLVDGDVTFAEGEPEKAVRVFDEALHAYPEDASPWALIGAARAKLWQGKKIDPAAREKLEALLSDDDPLAQLEIHGVIGHALLLENDARGATKRLAAARAVLAKRPKLTFRTQVDALEARILAHGGDREGALKVARRAVADARALGIVTAAIEHALLVAELGDRSGLAAVRAEAEKASHRTFAARAVALEAGAGSAPPRRGRAR